MFLIFIIQNGFLKQGYEDTNFSELTYCQRFFYCGFCCMTLFTVNQAFKTLKQLIYTQ